MCLLHLMGPARRVCLAWQQAQVLWQRCTVALLHRPPDCLVVLVSLVVVVVVVGLVLLLRQLLLQLMV
jgi:hypothetical protein